MKKKIYINIVCLFLLNIQSVISQPSPQADLKKFRSYFLNKFTGLSLQEFSNGSYAIDKKRRLEWQALEEFPAYEPALNIGKKLFHEKFKNGKTYSSCFKNKGIGISQSYPYFYPRTGKIKTLAAEINQCRVRNGEKKLPWNKGKLAAILAYMAYSSRGNKINVIVPNDPLALDIYIRGKTFFYSKRGQLNFSCADCHVYLSGKTLRNNLLSPALGQVTHFPVYRKKWQNKIDDPIGGLGTLHRRYRECNRQVQAKPFNAQSEIYTALEFFHSFMSNGIKINAPGIRP